MLVPMPNSKTAAVAPVAILRQEGRGGLEEALVNRTICACRADRREGGMAFSSA